MKRKIVPLRTKIFTLVFCLLFFIVAGMSAVFYWIQAKETADQVHQLSLQTAQTISFMPETSAFLTDDRKSDTLLPVLEHIQERTAAQSISIAGRNGTALSTYQNAQPLHESDSRSLIYGGSYTVEEKGTDGEAIIGKAPIVQAADGHSEVIGTVSVEFSKKSIAAQIASQTGNILLAAALALLVGIAGGLWLTRSILSDTLGFEPVKIASLYKKTIDEIRLYSDELRAQTHEFMNKLYVLSGLLQLGRHEAALEFIQREADSVSLQQHIVFKQIKDDLIQAVLLGKTAKASEKKISFSIEQESVLSGIPSHMDGHALLTIISNLIDNAFEAVRQKESPCVSFLITDASPTLIIEVTDNGTGIGEQTVSSLFEKGVSTKGENRGFGLYNVKEAVDACGGVIEVLPNDPSGTIFTIYIPKNAVKGDGHG
ncbi:ATP-binding protein [Domibacillus sp. PGB-M46]|uniref:ATP-binding protein n=1 Tax=Domibacillus sp. PGB-M46 TaxID=2910255 RepID=UPI001F5A8123|nr:ATP-binding protein [Domibacillus sp. PGB-M46]MCI2253967.1 ATP-binding protein [Domibacillus sp. PGB-M46]